MQFRSAPAIFVVALGLLLSMQAFGNDWAKVSTPAPGQPQTIGTYTAGCVIGAVRLPNEGDGYEAVRLGRNRHWGHPLAIGFTIDLAQRYRRLGLPHIYVGDIGQPRGGPAYPLHASHQAGLDIDIWFEIGVRARLAADARENLPIRSLVLKGDAGIDLAVWQEGHGTMLRTAAQQPATDRIFVNKWIKRHLCDTASGDRGWLRKVTPWFGHDEHFHIRLHCPADSPKCRAQAAMPPGDGCDRSLDWWFLPQPPPSGTPPPARPALPAECATVLGAP